MVGDFVNGRSILLWHTTWLDPVLWNYLPLWKGSTSIMALPKFSISAVLVRMYDNCISFT
jgi:hypothetical protein